MVGISFKKKVSQVVHLESYTSYKEYKETHKIKVPIDSFICYAIQKFCKNQSVVIRFIPIRTEPENQKPSVTLVEEEGEEFIFLINEYEIPWTVALCEYPVLMVEDVIITGLCAVTRQICIYRNSYVLRQEHDDGLLGFRHTCLQAPNEVSVWTKFCEIEIIRTVKELFKAYDTKEGPVPVHTLARFEEHMRLPSRVHNVYKVAQDLKKESLLKEIADSGEDVEQKTNAEPQPKTEQQRNAEQVEQKAKSNPKNFENINAGRSEQKEKSKSNQVEQENAGQARLKAKHQTNSEQQENAQQTEQQLKSQHKTNVEQAKHQTNAEQEENGAKTEQKVKPKHEHEKNVEQQESDEQLEKAEKISKIDHGKSDDKQDLTESGEGSSTKRSSKSRKWKSQTKKNNTIDSSTKIEDLEVRHEFAEGPYLTLADLVLLPSFHVIIQIIGEAQFASEFPFTYKWYKNLTSINPIQETFMSLMSHFDIKQLTIDKIGKPPAEQSSLYKCDPKRHNPKKRIYTNSDDIEKALGTITEGLELPMCEYEYQPTFKWNDIPEPANPFAGYLPDTRVQRKSEQLQCLALPVLKMATDGDVIVDFCCGCGHLGILLAYLLPRCTIILLENKVESLCRAKDRVKKMRLTNVYYYQCNLDFFTGEFDIGIGLHACGAATDLIMDKCINQNARFIISPCCYGALHGSCRMHFPRSEKFGNIDYDDYLCIAHGADQTHKDHPLADRGARCMKVIDSDRAHWAEEFGYKVTLTTLKPYTCTPKNHLLIGIPTEK